MDKFIQKLHFDFSTNQRVLQLIGYIDGFKGKWDIAEYSGQSRPLIPEQTRPLKSGMRKS
jgi:hypothetical protein